MKFAWQATRGFRSAPLQDFAAKVHNGLVEGDWMSKREMIRALALLDVDPTHGWCPIRAAL